MTHLKAPEKQKEIASQKSDHEEIIKLRAEINKMEAKKQETKTTKQ